MKIIIVLVNIFLFKKPFYILLSTIFSDLEV